MRLEHNIKRFKEKGYHIDVERVELLGFGSNKNNSNVRKEKSIFDLKKNTIHTCPVMPNTQKTIYGNGSSLFRRWLFHQSCNSYYTKIATESKEKKNKDKRT